MNDVFQPHKNPRNVSHWVELFAHRISAAGAPGRSRLDQWVLAGVTDVVTLQRPDEMPEWLPGMCEAAGLGWRHFPLSGKRLQDPEDPRSLRLLGAWIASLRTQRDPRSIVVHCSAGLHRTGVALYVAARASGMPPEDACEWVEQARGLTGFELVRQGREGRLTDRAERFWSEA